MGKIKTNKNLNVVVHVWPHIDVKFWIFFKIYSKGDIFNLSLFFSISTKSDIVGLSISVDVFCCVDYC